MFINYFTVGTPSLTPDGEVRACPEETLTFTCQTQSWLMWTIKFEDVAVSYVEHTYLPSDPQGRTTTQDRNGIQFTFNLTTSNMTSTLLESTMNVVANHTLLNGTIVECEGTGSVTPNTVIHMRGIKTVYRV